MKMVVKDIDTYLATLPEPDSVALEKLRQIIRSVAPDAEEGIGYGMPMFKYHGMLVAFAAAKNHYGFYPCNGSTVEIFKDDLKGYGVSKGAIRLPKDKPLPTALIKKMVKSRIKENLIKEQIKKGQ